MRTAIAATALFFAACCVSAGAAAPAMTVEMLRAQADAWDAAIIRKDRAAIEANMADSFFQIGSDGETADKARFLQGITSDKLVIEPYTVEDFRVRFYGDTALITGDTDMHGSWDGKPFHSHYRFTDTYVREADGKWRVVNVQTTEVRE
jgi:ketosteroid isomerase-like protein